MGSSIDLGDCDRGHEKEMGMETGKGMGMGMGMVNHVADMSKCRTFLRGHNDEVLVPQHVLNVVRALVKR